MRSLLLISLAVTLSACQTHQKNAADWDVPLTLRTVGPAYADYVIEKADTNKDGKVTLLEWTKAGGTEKCFLLVDQNKNGAVTRTELIRFGSNKKFLDFARRYTDFHKDNKLTPRDFRSPSGVRLLRIEF
jgi:EF hand